MWYQGNAVIPAVRTNIKMLGGISFIIALVFIIAAAWAASIITSPYL